MKCIYKKHELNKINSDNTAFNRDSSAAHNEIIDEEHCRLLGIINAANIGTWELNVQTGETTVNERWCEIIGYTINDLTPLTIKTWSLLLHPEDLARMNDSIDKYLTGHSSFFDIEYRMQHKDGNWIWIHSHGKIFARTPHGKPLYINGTHTDITRRMRYEKSLEDNNIFLEDVFNSIQDAVFVLNKDFTIRHHNNILTNWYHESATYAGNKCFSVFNCGTKPCEGCPTVRSFLSGHTETAVLTGRKHASVAWMEISSYPLKNRNTGEITGAIVLTRDVTRRKGDEEQLRRTNALLAKQTEIANTMAEQARRASEAKSEFLANMSHEIRTPMNGLIGMTSLLFETPLNQEQQQYLEIIQSCGNSLLTLINDILDFSKIEAGRLEIESIDFDLCSLLKNFAEMIAPRVYEKKLEFIIDISPQIPHLLNGDPYRLQQILTNLVGNAIKFTQTGEIVVSCNIEYDYQDEILLRFNVRDSGVGIPGEKQHLLFTKFTQVDSSATRRYSGTGLGLAISKQLAHLMGGEIGIISPVKESLRNSCAGSEFWFTIRFKKQQIQKPEICLSDRFKNMSALIVNENPVFRQHIKKILYRFNINVCEASNDDEVLTLFKNDPATRISLDIVLTTQLTESFSNQDLKKRTSELYPDLKATFVLICDSTHKSDYSDFSACIPKPVFPDTLHACIEQLFNSARKIPAEVQKHHCYDVASFNDSRILLVEDNLVNQKVASVILSKWKLQVDTAQNGYEALKLLSIYPYDLVLMDVQMPGLDGCKTTQLIRSGEYNVINPEIPVIAMTAHTMNGDRENCLVSGMDDYISKPFNIDQLFTILNKWISPQDNENSFSNVLSPLQTPGN